MTYFCYVDYSTSSVPHMEPLAAADLADALSESQQILAEHASGYAARIFKGGRHLVTLRPLPGRHVTGFRRPNLAGDIVIGPVRATALKSDPRSVIH